MDNVDQSEINNESDKNSSKDDIDEEISIIDQRLKIIDSKKNCLVGPWMRIQQLAKKYPNINVRKGLDRIL